MLISAKNSVPLWRKYGKNVCRAVLGRTNYLAVPEAKFDSSFYSRFASELAQCQSRPPARTLWRTKR